MVSCSHGFLLLRTSAVRLYAPDIVMRVESLSIPKAQKKPASRNLPLTGTDSFRLTVSFLFTPQFEDQNTRSVRGFRIALDANQIQVLVSRWVDG